MPGSHNFMPPLPIVNPIDQDSDSTRSPGVLDPFRDDPVQAASKRQLSSRLAGDRAGSRAVEGATSSLIFRRSWRLVWRQQLSPSSRSGGTLGGLPLPSSFSSS